MSKSLQQQLSELRESCVADEEAEKEQQQAEAEVCAYVHIYKEVTWCVDCSSGVMTVIRIFCASLQVNSTVWHLTCCAIVCTPQLDVKVDYVRMYSIRTY